VKDGISRGKSVNARWRVLNANILLERAGAYVADSRQDCPWQANQTDANRIAFYILEEVVVGVFRGRIISQSFPAIWGGSLQGLLSMGAIVFVAPFFAFRELARVIRQRELWSLLLKRGTRVYILQSSPQY